MQFAETMGAAGELYPVLEHSRAKICLEIKNKKHTGMLRNQILAPGTQVSVFPGGLSHSPVAVSTAYLPLPEPRLPQPICSSPGPPAAPTGVKLTPTGPSQE